MLSFISNTLQNLREKSDRQAQIERIEKEHRQKKVFLDLIEAADNFTFVKFNGTDLSWNTDTGKNAHYSKLELRILKKIALAKKREISTEFKNLRAEYNHQVGSRVPITFFPGRTAKMIIRAGRAVERTAMADLTAERDTAIRPWDQIIDALERAIIACELKEIKE